MDWIIFAFITPAIYTISNYVDKYNLERQIKDYSIIPVYSSITGLIIGTIFWCVNSFPTLNSNSTFLVLGSGILTTFAGVFYFKAISTEEVSKIIFFFQLQPIMLLILARIILHEDITLNQIIGFLIVFLAVFCVSVKINKDTFKLTSGLIYIVIADFLAVIGTIMIKAATNINSFPKILSYESWGIALGGLILVIFLPDIRSSFIKSTKELKKSAIAIVFISGIIFVIGKITGYYAFSLGPVALVSVIISTQVFYGIIYGLFLTLLFPSIFKEDISKQSLINKFIFMIILLIGIFVISIK